MILSASEVIQNRTVLAFQITFTKPLNPGSLSDLSHYALFDQASRNRYHGAPVPLSSVTYNLAQQTLTLAPITPAPVASYTLTSPNSADRSTAFITDQQGRPLLTSTGNFTVYFQPAGVSLRNLVVTDSPVINKETGANILINYRAQISAINQSTANFQSDLGISSIARGGLAGAALLLRGLG